jgi:adenylate kinase
MFNFSVFGAPGSGKGTQSVKLSAKYGLKHISTGDLFRKEIAANSLVGQYVKNFVDKGQLIPDATVLKEVYRTALCHKYAKGYIFDGFPRTLVQAEMMDRLLEKKCLHLKLVIWIVVEERELLERLHSRAEDSDRSDDKKEVIMERMETYKKMTYPVIKYYQKKGNLIEISGMHPVEEVFATICTKIDGIINSNHNLY